MEWHCNVHCAAIIGNKDCKAALCVIPRLLAYGSACHFTCCETLSLLMLYGIVISYVVMHNQCNTYVVQQSS